MVQNSFELVCRFFCSQVWLLKIGRNVHQEVHQKFVSSSFSSMNRRLVPSSGRAGGCAAGCPARGAAARGAAGCAAGAGGLGVGGLGAAGAAAGGWT